MIDNQNPRGTIVSATEEVTLVTSTATDTGVSEREYGIKELLLDILAIVIVFLVGALSPILSLLFDMSVNEESDPEGLSGRAHLRAMLTAAGISSLISMAALALTGNFDIVLIISGIVHAISAIILCIIFLIAMKEQLEED